MSENLLEVKNLKVSFFSESSKQQIIRGFDISLKKGEIVGILGESGSGKTVSTSSIIKLYEPGEAVIDDGTILFEGKDLAQTSEKALKEIRGKKIAYVFQNPTLALHPNKHIGKQLLTLLKVHKLPNTKDIILDALTEVGIENPNLIYDKYPAQLSAGQNQRIMIAGCILCKPDLLIADEPTSSIDASLRKKILDLFLYINKKYNMSIIVITHDFDIAKYLCSSVMIMYGGLNVEYGNLQEVLKKPLHPYTEELIRCAQSLDSKDETLYSLEGTPLTPKEFEDNCPFYKRCRYKQDDCLKCIPEILEFKDRRVRCIEPVVNKRTLENDK